MNKTLGQLKPDPYGAILGTGFQRFMSPLGVDGLCKVEDGRLDILAVHSLVVGHGYFRRFIAAIKSEFPHIRIMHIHNATLPKILTSYGFTPFEDVDSIQGETEFITGMEWRQL